MNKKTDIITQNKNKKREKLMFLFNISTIEEFNKICNKYNIIYDYFSPNNRIKLNDIRKLIKFYNNQPKKISYDILTHFSNNYSNGLIIILYKLSVLPYNYNISKSLKYLEKYRIKTKSKLYLLYYINKTLFITIRGTKYIDEFKKGSFESDRIKYNFENKDTHHKFLEWKEEFIKDFNKNKKNTTNVPELKHKNIYVHKNYYSKSILILKDIKPIIKNLTKKGLNNVILTGHSMGGSLSMILGLKLKEIYKDKFKVHITSFSNLGIGNRNLSLFAIYLGINSYIRIYNKSDVVDSYKSSLFYKLVGRLRHLDHSFTKKYYSKYITYDIEKNIPTGLLNKIKTIEHLKLLYSRHIMYKFSNNKNAPVFI